MEFVYFPNSGMVSVVATMRDGASVEVGNVGREGFFSTAVLLWSLSIPLRAIVQIKGDAFAIEPTLLRNVLWQTPHLQSMLRQYANAYCNQVAQVAACNCLHQVRARLARWLLMSRDRSDSDSMPLTQEFLAQMLGCRRSSIVAAVGSLEKLGVVRSSRGRVHIVNRTKLEKTACECYEVIHEMLPPQIRI
jgi:CRP-like cAMP-binding protein